MPLCERCNKQAEKLINAQFQKGQSPQKVCPSCMRFRNLFWNYGLTESEYNKMLKEQGYVCAICLKPELECKRSGPGGKPGLVVDHKHGTKVVRGLLCHHCNSLIGYSMENVEILERAIAYLKSKAAYGFT